MWNRVAYDGFNEETYREIPFVLPLAKPVVVAVDAGHGVAAVQGHEEFHDIVADFVEVVHVAVEVWNALVRLVAVVVNDNRVADGLRSNRRPGHRWAVLRPS